MTLIDFGDIKLRFDTKEVRINIDGDMIDIGARSNNNEESFDPNDYELPPAGHVFLGKHTLTKKKQKKKEQED